MVPKSINIYIYNIIIYNIIIYNIIIFQIKLIRLVHQKIKLEPITEEIVNTRIEKLIFAKKRHVLLKI